MNKLIYICILLMIGITNQAYGQDFLQLFKNKNYSKIENHLSPDVKLKLGQGKRISGKSNVMSSLKDYLNTFNPTDLNIKHSGSSEEKENYLLGRLKNAKNEDMRIFVHLENGPSGKQICDIKIR